MEKHILTDRHMRTRLAYDTNKSFPAYGEAALQRVPPRRLFLATQRATAHFTEHAHHFRRVFRRYICRRWRCKPSAVKFARLHASLRRIRSAALVDCDDCYGWTDGATIYVSRQVEMTFAELVGTLLHEELHCFCQARGKFLGAECDHHCMRVLGER